MQVSAFTSHAAWCSFLTERRVVSVAARRSTALALTPTPSNQAGSRGRRDCGAGCGPRAADPSPDPWLPRISSKAANLSLGGRRFKGKPERTDDRRFPTTSQRFQGLIARSGRHRVRSPNDFKGLSARGGRPRRARTPSAASGTGPSAAHAGRGRPAGRSRRAGGRSGTREGASATAADRSQAVTKNSSTARSRPGGSRRNGPPVRMRVSITSPCPRR